MKLDAARLCLDCDEVHEEQICPACSSEAFAFLTRWVQPAIEREQRVTDARPRLPAAAAAGEERPAPVRTPEQVAAYRQLLSGAPAPRRQEQKQRGEEEGTLRGRLQGTSQELERRPGLARHETAQTETVSTL